MTSESSTATFYELVADGFRRAAGRVADIMPECITDISEHDAGFSVRVLFTDIDKQVERNYGPYPREGDGPGLDTSVVPDYRLGTTTATEIWETKEEWYGALVRSKAHWNTFTRYQQIKLTDRMYQSLLDAADAIEDWLDVPDNVTYTHGDWLEATFFMSLEDA